MLSKLDLARRLENYVRDNSGTLTRATQKELRQIADILRDSLSSEGWKISIVDGQIKLRGDEGLSGELSEEQQFIRINNSYFPVSRLVSGPALLESQLKIAKERLL